MYDANLISWIGGSYFIFISVVFGVSIGWWGAISFFPWRFGFIMGIIGAKAWVTWTTKRSDDHQPWIWEWERKPGKQSARNSVLN